MLGGKNKQLLGYTIIEVMIVLAVSGIMFLIAADFINGKQERTAFTEGVNDTASQIQNIIEQVNDGQYSDINLNCSFTYNPITEVGTTAAAVNTSGTPQGTNTDCVFLGKVIYFSYDSSAGSSPDYEVLSLAGGRVDNNGNPLTTVAQAGPTVIGGGLTSQQIISQGLIAQKITVNGGATSYGIGFLQNPALNSQDQLVGGAKTVGLYYVNGLGPGKQESGAANTISSSGLSNAASVDICLTDGTQYADVTLGGLNNDSQLNVDVVIHGKIRPPTC